MILHFLILFIFNSHADTGSAQLDSLKQLSNSEVKKTVSSWATLTHKPITYKVANLALFTNLDNHQGSVSSVYSPSDCLVTDIVPSPKLMNIEHTWPQSEGANGIAKSDLHHLYVTTSSTNSIRSSLPFCNVTIVKWSADQSKRGLNSFGEHCFEPPAAHKGNVARALFYFSIRYNFPIENHQESYLRLWNKEDPVDAADLVRDQNISKLQGNNNPFVTTQDLVDFISDF